MFKSFKDIFTVQDSRHTSILLDVSSPHTPSGQCDIISSHKVFGVATGSDNCLNNRHGFHFIIESDFGGAESYAVDPSVDQNHHRRDHSHVHHDLQTVGGGRNDMREIKILFDELEENLYHPTRSVSFNHLGSGHVLHIRQKIYDVFHSVDDIAFGVYGIFVKRGFDMSINPGVGDRASGAEDLHHVKLPDCNAMRPVNSIFSGVVFQLLDNHSSSVIGNPDQKVDLLSSFAILGAQLLQSLRTRESSVYEVKIFMEAVILGGLSDDFRHRVVFRLLCLVIVEAYSEHIESVERLGVFDMIRRRAVLGFVAYMKAFGEFVAGFGHNGGIHRDKVQFLKLNRLIQRRYRAAQSLVKIAEELNLYGCKTLGYARMVGDDTVVSGHCGKLKTLPGEDFSRRTLAHPALCKQKMKEHVEHDASLKQFDMPVNIRADCKLLDDFRWNYVENLTHVFEFFYETRFHLDSTVHVSHPLNVGIMETTLDSGSWSRYVKLLTMWRLISPLMIEYNQYSDVFSSLDKLGLAGEVGYFLMPLLVPIHFGETSNADYNHRYVDIRKALEGMFRHMVGKGVLPPNIISKGAKETVNLSWSSLFLGASQPENPESLQDYDSEKKFWTKIERLTDGPIIPKQLADWLKSAIFQTGGAAHTTTADEELAMNLEKYLPHVGDSPYMLRALVMGLCDFILWYDNFIKKHPDEEMNAITFWRKRNSKF